MDRKHHLLSEVKTSCLIIIASYHPSIYLSYAHPIAHAKEMMKREREKKRKKTPVNAQQP
jgi:hypothetical protein